jgi:hypothetical protein
MQTMKNNEYRRRLIARVEALRTEAGMPMLRFRQQIGPVAARKWVGFVTASDEEAWNYFSLKAIDRIAQLFGLGAELLQFKSNQSKRRTNEC